MKYISTFLSAMALLVLRSQASYLPGYMGCYNDDQMSVLTYGASSAPHNIEGCVAACQAAGYLYAGLKEASQYVCSCGNDVSEMAWSDESACNFPCTQNDQETCGGSFTKSVYQTTLPNNFIGCYADSQSNPDFSSYTPVYTVPPGMNTDECAAHCGWQLYNYFVLTNGSDCRCSNNMPAYPQVPLRECNEACTWDEGQTFYPNMACGGNYINSFYARPHHKFGYQGCYRDDANRVLPDYITDVYLNWGENLQSALGCAGGCIQRTNWGNHHPNQYQNETYSGVEYGGECYCGDGTKMNTGVYQLLPDYYCSMTCNNNRAQWCGGSWAISIWHRPWNNSDL